MNDRCETCGKATNYNGWPNYETWAVALWIDIEQRSYGYWHDRAQECLDDAQEPGSRAYLTADERATHDLAEALKEDFETGKDEILDDARKSASVWADLLAAAMSEVDWCRLAEHYLDDKTPTVTTAHDTE